MKKPARATQAVAGNPAIANSKNRSFPFTGISWTVLGVSGLTILLCISAGATDILKGHVKVEQTRSAKAGAPDQAHGHQLGRPTPVTKTAGSLVDKYGAVANSPTVAAAIRNVEAASPNGAKSFEQASGAKAAADRYEALQHGHAMPGTDTTSIIMAGYVPPGMPPEQAAAIYKGLPNNLKVPHSLQTGTPEWISRMTNEPADPAANLPNGFTQEDARVANQKMFDGYMRNRFGPVYVPPLQRGHDWLAQHTHRTSSGLVADHQMSAIPLQYAGSIREMTDSSGNVVAQYGYDPYGRQTRIGGTGPDSDFGYDGIYVHQRSGLLMMGARLYNPVTGRFLNRDPIGEAGGVNLYAYVENNPISRIDPQGTTYTDLGGGGSISAPLGPAPSNPIGAKCWDQCKDKLPFLGPLLGAGGLPLLPAGGKTGLTTAGTSPISAGLRNLLGDWGSEWGPFYGPTWNAPFSGSTPSLGGAIGRLAFPVGVGVTGWEYKNFLDCIQKCIQCNSSK